MKLRISLLVYLSVLAPLAFAIHAPVQSSTAPGKSYIGFFGGGGSSNNLNANQFATAFFVEANGGPLSINAFGPLNNTQASFFGAQLGYQAQEIFLKSSSQWTLGPAAELEGLSISKRSFNGSLNNSTVRIPEHDFMVSYPMRSTIFLANAILSINHAHLPIHPYVGFGIGNAIVRISEASATQLNPAEVGVNHYNANASDTNSTFAGQMKLGFSYDVNKYVSLFAEYRRLYLASTHFVFGSTVYDNHVPTSSWQVNLSSQRYNLSDVGVRFNW
jgi:opacity protein-like surface antigen